MLPSEKQIQNAVIDWLNVHGFCCAQIDTVGIYDPQKKIMRKRKAGIRGTSDIWAVKGGISLALEIKTEYEKLKPHQMEFLLKHARAGGISAVIRNLADLEDFYKKYFNVLQGGMLAKDTHPLAIIKIWSRKPHLDFKFDKRRQL